MLWIVGTFLHVIFAFLGYLHIASASKRCGKSLLLELLSYLCFNATRTARADRRSRAALMAMLNAGFKRGTRVPRMMDSKTDFFREFNVYALRVLASIRALSATVADRGFRIELVQKRRGERL